MTSPWPSANTKSEASQDVMVVRVRPSRSEEGPVLRTIEKEAGERFRTIGMESVADHEPPSEEDLAAYAIGGRSWVAVDAADRPVGYVLVEELDGNAHVEQLSVLPDAQGNGMGRALLEQVRVWARETDHLAITLCTFTDVAWNRPLYEHLGFVVLPEAEIGPELRSLRQEEATHGLDPATRVCMRRDTNVSLSKNSF
jgi:GNAT superfamily N-acetyltransferase